MIFDEYIKENLAEFTAKEKEVSRYLWVTQEHLRFVMWFESRLNPRAQNPITKATGLIQFMPATAVSLGTTIDELMNKTNVEQLDYVKKFLSPFSTEFQDFVDLYCAIFWPAAVGKADTFVIGSHMVAKQNPIFDIDKDGDIEKSEIRAALLKQIPAKYIQFFQS
jgi:hypothetical protein